MAEADRGPLQWSIDSITDEVYRTKFVKLPDIIADFIAPFGGEIRGRDLLDFGCGEATTAMGLALRYDPARVVGVDMGPDLERCAPLAREQLGFTRLPDNLALHRVAPGRLHDDHDRFDLIYSWSVFEHVDQSLMTSVLAALHRALKPSGFLFVQIAPLYYSLEGSHVVDKIADPFAHLWMQSDLFENRLESACSTRSQFDSLLNMYRTLNRITAPELVDAIRKAGFTVLREYMTTNDGELPARVTAVFSETVLRTDQIVVLAQKHDRRAA
jgi:cyclopropane fatty-acyl-phospholipid synthase-like methyltransferase